MQRLPFTWAKDKAKLPPLDEWLPRVVLTGVIVGLAGAAHIILGLRLF